jgi:dethiobiotin synthase
MINQELKRSHKKARCASFFITGTTTGIGKTFISSLLVNGLSSEGTVSYMKPVQTGCTLLDNEKWNAPDYEFVNKHAKPQIVSSFSDHVPYCFEPACSPHLAASIKNETIDFNRIGTSYQKIASHVDFTIVEGAGGIFAPVSETTYIIDLIKFLNIPVILVTSPGLGTLNHTFLTIKQLREAHIPIAGVVMNNHDNVPEDYIYEDNRRMIGQFSEPVPFLEVSYGAISDELTKAFCQRIRSI